jgi:hemoglobin
MSDTLYTRLGGYAAIVAVVDDLLARLKADTQLGRFWQHRGEDGVFARGSCLSISYARQPAVRSCTSGAI